MIQVNGISANTFITVTLAIKKGDRPNKVT